MNDLFFFNPPASLQFDFDSRPLNSFLEREPLFLTCMSCGGCTATCSAENLVDFNVRKIGLILRRGGIEKLTVEIEECMFCGNALREVPDRLPCRNRSFSPENNSTDRIHTTI